MAGSERNAFQQVFPNKELFRRSSRSALIWSGLSSLLLCLLLFDLYLFADLLIDRGELSIPGSEIETLTPLAGDILPELPSRVPNQGQNFRVTFRNRGILPAVWWSRNRYWGPAVAWSFREFEVLQTNQSALLVLILSAAFIGVVRSRMLSRARTLSARVGLDVVTRLRKTLHRQSLRLGPSDVEQRDADRVYEMFTTEIDKLRQGIFLRVYHLGRYLPELVLLVALSISIHWLVALQCLIPLGACWVLVQVAHRRFEAARRLSEDRARSDLQLLAEGLHKTRLVRGYGMEDFEHEQFQKSLERFSKNVKSLSQEETSTRWNVRFLVMASVIIVLFLIGKKVLLAPNQLSAPAAFFMLAAFSCMHRPLESLWLLQFEFGAARQAASKIKRYTGEIPEVGQAVGAKFLQPVAKSIQFEAVTYDLPGKYRLLDKFDLKLPAGGVTAFVSLDPLESRALAYLLPRFIEPHSGRILFDGEDIAWVTLESLRAEAIYVGGTDPSFTGTVFENITCGREEYSLQKATQAAKSVHAHNFILKLSQGYETFLGEHGEQLGVGEGFRLGLARAALRDPALMIIEEPATPLDDDTKSMIDDAYNRLLENRTVIFLPTRLSTLRRADQIILVHAGKVEATGKHAQLVKTSQMYRHWEYTRFNEFQSADRSTE